MNVYGKNTSSTHIIKTNAFPGCLRWTKHHTSTRTYLEEKEKRPFHFSNGAPCFAVLLVRFLQT
jgi:hypothetical protein